MATADTGEICIILVLFGSSLKKLLGVKSSMEGASSRSPAESVHTSEIEPILLDFTPQ